MLFYTQTAPARDQRNCTERLPAHHSLVSCRLAPNGTNGGLRDRRGAAREHLCTSSTMKGADERRKSSQRNTAPRAENQKRAGVASVASMDVCGTKCVSCEEKRTTHALCPYWPMDSRSGKLDRSNQHLPGCSEKDCWCAESQNFRRRLTQEFERTSSQTAQVPAKLCNECYIGSAGETQSHHGRWPTRQCTALACNAVAQCSSAVSKRAHASVKTACMR